MNIFLIYLIGNFAIYTCLRIFNNKGHQHMVAKLKELHGTLFISYSLIAFFVVLLAGLPIAIYNTFSDD